MWLRAALINATMAGFILMSGYSVRRDTDSASLHQAAQIALMHAMGTIACATLMNLGASFAARVPVFFVLGTLFYSVPVYLSWPQGNVLYGLRTAGMICPALGWFILLLSVTAVDREPMEAGPE